MASIDVDVEGLDFLRQMARQAAPDTYEAIEETLRRERNRLIGATPRGDGRPLGHLADKWDYKILVYGDGITGRLENLQPYAGYARGPWPDKRTHVHKLALNKRNQRRLADEIIERAGDSILTGARRG